MSTPFLTLGELIDALETLRQQHDSATTVAIDDADTDWHLVIEKITYDPKLDRVLLRGEYNSEYEVPGGR